MCYGSVGADEEVRERGPARTPASPVLQARLAGEKGSRPRDLGANKGVLWQLVIEELFSRVAMGDLRIDHGIDDQESCGSETGESLARPISPGRVPGEDVDQDV